MMTAARNVAVATEANSHPRRARMRGGSTNNQSGAIVTRKLVFDIETAPQSVDQLLNLFPWDPSTVDLGSLADESPFDESSVKCGHLGPEKAREKIEAARQEHAARMASRPKLIDQAIASAKSSYEFKLQDTAALRAETCNVLAIGYRENTKFKIDHFDGDESKLLAAFWEQFKALRKTGGRMIGFNNKSFDVPIIVRRSFILGVEIPEQYLDGRYLSGVFIDLLDIWKCCSFQESIKLDVLARVLGIPGKNGNGKFFWKLWKEDRQKATEYLKNDLNMTYESAVKLGVI